MAMFSDPAPTPPASNEPLRTPDEPQLASSHEPAERPSAEIDPADELLHDPTVGADEESKRRWFNR
jgi:hypothetical protein